MRIGIFGGSFDPVHLGHLILAEACREHLKLDRVLLVPAAISPLKRHGPQADAEDRVAMLRLAVGDHPAMQVETCELERGGVSYTLDTVRYLQARYQPQELFLLIGADSVASLSAWKAPHILLQEVTLGVVKRAGEPEPDLAAAALLLASEHRHAFSPQCVPMPAIGISSTDLRERAARGRSLRYLVPQGVEAYIHNKSLYGS
jgi:nicotinate-nucleotide adenylyltransferase